MRIEKGLMVALGYGKYIRSDRVVALQPIEEGRGPGKRTKVHVEGVEEPLVASRSEAAILRDLISTPVEIVRAGEQQRLLEELVDTMSEINPMLRSIVREQGSWDLDALEKRVKAVLTVG